MKKVALLSTFLVNMIFMMLTTLLPLLIYDAAHSYSSVGIILFIFMLSVITTRIIVWNKSGSYRSTLMIGSICFLSCFVLLYLYPKCFFSFFPDAVLLGIGIGLIPPLMLTFLTDSSNKKKYGENIGQYNVMTAISAAIGPEIANLLFNYSIKFLLFIWLGGCFILLISNGLIAKHYSFQNSNSNSSVINFIKAKSSIVPLLLLATISITYGTIIGYLPIYFERISVSIGLFYLFFWMAYTLAQFITRIKGTKSSYAVIIILMTFSLALVSFQNNFFCPYSAGFIYGLCYGSIFKSYYSQMALIKDERQKNNGYGIVGLMSYVGVGLAQVFTYPFMKLPIQYVFVLSAIYTLPFLLVFAFTKVKIWHGGSAG